jgi:hypothetical protein
MTHNEEVIVFGKGIGFGVKEGDLISFHKIEKNTTLTIVKTKISIPI